MKEPLRVLSTAPYYWPEVGGLENVARELTERLNARDGVEVVPVASCSCEDTNEHHRLDTGAVHLPTTTTLYHTPVGVGWRDRLRELIRDERADAVLTHTPVPFMADASVRAAAEEGVPSLLFHHNDLDPRTVVHRAAIGLYRLALGRSTLEMTDRVIVTSEAYARESRELSRFEGKTSVVPPGVDTDRFHPANAAERGGPPEIVFVGRLDETSSHKGLPVLFQALERLAPDHAFELSIVGEGDRRGAYQREVHDLGLDDRTRFFGFVDDDELAEIYARARTVCLPSVTRSEGFGLVLLEAQASGTPVIGSDIGGIPQALEPDESGFLVEPGSAADLANRIERLLSDPELATAMGQRGRQRVLERFAWEATAERTLSLLSEVST